MIKGPVGHKICCILGEMGVLSAIVRLEITMGLRSVLMINFRGCRIIKEPSRLVQTWGHWLSFRYYGLMDNFSIIGCITILGRRYSLHG